MSAAASTLMTSLARYRPARTWTARLAPVAVLMVWHAATLSAQSSPASGTRAASIALGCLQAAPLLWRRSHPWPVFSAVAGACLVTRLISADPSAPQTALFLTVAVYNVAQHRAVSNGAVAASAATVLMAGPELAGRWGLAPVPHPAPIRPVDAAAFVLIFGAAWCLGSGRRRVRADAERLRRLTEQLRREREINIAQATVAERARIARDLHDSVAHHVSAIALQARTTAETLRDRPHDAAEEVERIGDSSEAALVEMRQILGLLNEGRGAEPRPEPSLSHLQSLVCAAQAGGCRVQTVVDESISCLVPALQVAIYRIVQEALTNVVKHAGPVDVRIELRRAAGTIRVVVHNGPTASPRSVTDRVHRPVTGFGRGLVGMRERAALWQGRFHAGPDPSGGWQVSAIFPDPER
jgi:signal transduction histidine kinase